MDIVEITDNKSPIDISEKKINNFLIKEIILVLFI